MNDSVHVVIYTHDTNGETVEWRCACSKRSWQTPCACVFPDPRGVGVLARDHQASLRVDGKTFPEIAKSNSSAT